MSQTMHTTNGRNGLGDAVPAQGNGHDSGLATQPSGGHTLLPGRASLAALDAFRTLALTVDRLSVETPARSIVLLSAAPGEGRSVSSELLGLALGEVRPPVRLLDADPFRHPVEPGLGRSWRPRWAWAPRAQAGVRPESVLEQPAAGDGRAFARISVARQSHPSHTTFLREVRAVLDTESATGATVIVDVPACIVSSLGFAVAEMVDAAIYVVRPGRAPVETHRDVLAQLALLDVNVLGVLLNEG